MSFDKKIKSRETFFRCMETALKEKERSCYILFNTKRFAEMTGLLQYVKSRVKYEKRRESTNE